MYKLKCISLLFAVLADVSAAKTQDNVIDEVGWVVGD